MWDRLFSLLAVMKNIMKTSSTPMNSTHLIICIWKRNWTQQKALAKEIWWLGKKESKNQNGVGLVDGSLPNL